MAVWQTFKCNNPACGWNCPGTYSHDPAYKGYLPDTDCPACGYHDSVTGREDCEAPGDLAAVRAKVRGVGLKYGWDVMTGARPK